MHKVTYNFRQSFQTYYEIYMKVLKGLVCHRK